MKKIFFSFLCLIVFSLIINSCKKNQNPSDGGNSDNSNYFPSNLGNSYLYNIERRDSNNVQTTGTRQTRYSATSEKGGVYILQTDSVTSDGTTSVRNSYFRKTENGVYYFLDTTGFSSNLPPEYASFLQYIKFDTEFLLLYLPLTSGKSWTVFKVNLEEQGASFTVVDVRAKYVAVEDILLNLITGNITRSAAKIEYEFSVINPITQAKETVSAFGWFVPDIGPVKWEGNSLLLNVFTTGKISLADSSSTGSDNLVRYNLK